MSASATDVDDFEDVPGWILDAVYCWHASVAFDGYTHESACGLEFDDWRDFQRERPYANRTKEVCGDCLEVLDL